MPRALVLFSGGLDSTTCVAIAHEQGFEPVLLTFSYGQRHDTTRVPPSEFTERFGVKEMFSIHLPHFGQSSSLSIGSEQEVPKDRDPREPGIPNTYVPARNLIFLSYAVSIAEEEAIRDIFIGCSEVDYSGYPDCRDRFLHAFERAAREGTRAGAEAGDRRAPVRIRSPVMWMTKAEIIKKGLALGVDYSQTFSCYDPQEVEVGDEETRGIELRACGRCDSCQLRLEGFQGVGTEVDLPGEIGL